MRVQIALKISTLKRGLPYIVTIYKVHENMYNIVTRSRKARPTATGVPKKHLKISIHIPVRSTRQGNQ